MNNSLNLKDVLRRAQAEGWAVGHFNISNLEFLKAVAEAASKLRSPVMIGVSEGERDFFSTRALPRIVEEYGLLYGAQLFLNADHTKSVERAKEAIDAGFLSVHFDGSTSLTINPGPSRRIDGSGLPLEENIKKTKEVVDYAHMQNPEISIEGEVGYIRGASTVSTEYIEVSLDDYTKPEEARRFVEATGVDRLAVAVGNVHGINLKEPKLDFERISKIKEAVGDRISLVLHAGSGIPDEDIKEAIKAGISNIHISTELRQAWKDVLTRNLSRPDDSKNPPYHILELAQQKIREIIEQKIELFGSPGTWS